MFLGVFKHYKRLCVYMFKKNFCCFTEVLLYFSNDSLKCHLYDLGSKVIQTVLPVVSCYWVILTLVSKNNHKGVSVAFKKFSF